MAQPLIVGIRSDGDTEKISYYVLVEKTFITCGYNFTNAFRVLYSSFYAFDLNYPPTLHMFFMFFDEIVFKVKGIAGKLSPSTAAFLAQLTATTLND